MKGVWVPEDTRDQIVDFVNRWSGTTGIAVVCFLLGIGLGRSKWHPWKSRYGKANEHNAWIPQDHWLEESEKQAIVNFHAEHPPAGYRRLPFMMPDADGVAASPSSVYRVLKAAGCWSGIMSSLRRRAPGLFSPYGRMSTGMWTWRT